MKAMKILIILVLAMGVMVCAAKVGNAAEIGTAFTYQGRLIDANSVADGLYDFQFKLYGDPCVGPLIAGPVNEPVLDVIDGYFTVELDFGSVFDGDGRWLEIGIRDYDPCDVNVFTVLIPRQELTPTPYAIYAKSAQTGGSDNDWMVSGNDMYSIPPGNVGIGTTEPASKLHIYSPYDPTVLQIHSSAGFGAGKIEFWSDPEWSPSLWRPGSITSTDNGDYTGGLAFLVNGSGDANKTNETEVMRIVNGAVGIGTTVPSGGTLRVEQGDNPAALLVNTATGADLSVKYGGINEIVSIGSWTVGGIHFYSTCCGYTEPNDGSIQLYPRSGDAVFKGSIGIGTTDPCDETKVHVRTASDNFGILIDSYATSGSEIGLHTSSSKYASLVKNAFFDGSWQRFDTSSGAFLQEISPAGKVEFKVTTAGANPISYWYEALTLKPDGNVGVGENDPAWKLDVLGHINSNWSYKLDGDTVLYNSNGPYSIFVGKDAGTNNFGGYCTGIGYEALYTNVGGYYNTAVGANALHDTTTGDNYNVALGCNAGYSTQGSGNVFLGYQAGANETGSDKLYIDNSDTSTPLIYGNFSTNRVGINRIPTSNALEVEGDASKSTAGDWAANSDKRIKTNIKTITDALETLNKVRLVSFKYTNDYRNEHSSVEDRRYLNVIAQEFREVFPDYVKSSGEKLNNGDEILQVDAYPLTIYSAAAVQELHEIVKAKDAEITQLKERVSKMEGILNQMINDQKGAQQ